MESLKITEPVAKSTMKGLKTILVVCLGEFTTFLSLFILASFYPKYAEERGITGVSIGTITGIPMAPVLFAVYSSVIICKYISPKTQAVCGLFVTSLTLFCFGVLDWLPLSEAAYTGLAITLRLVQGVGIAATDVCLFIYAAEAAPPERASLVVGSVEFSVDMAMAISPILGGAIFQIGGYQAPFLSLAIWTALVAILCIFVLPPANSQEESEQPLSRFIKLSFAPDLLLCLWFFLSVHLCVGFLTGMIEPHLRKFDLSPSGVGAIIFATEAASAATFPFWGYLCQKKMSPYVMCLTGCFLGAIGFLLFGPFPYFNFELKLWIVIVSLILVGFSSSSILLSVYTQANDFAKYLGCDDATRTAVISAMYTGISGFGLFMGAFVGGFFIDYVGYRNGSAVLFGAQIIGICLQLLITYRLDGKKSGESLQLLKSANTSWPDSLSKD